MRAAWGWALVRWELQWCRPHSGYASNNTLIAICCCRGWLGWLWEGLSQVGWLLVNSPWGRPWTSNAFAVACCRLLGWCTGVGTVASSALLAAALRAGLRGSLICARMHHGWSLECSVVGTSRGLVPAVVTLVMLMLPARRGAPLLHLVALPLHTALSPGLP